MSAILTLEVMRATRGHKYTGSTFRLLLELAESRNGDTGRIVIREAKLAARLGVNAGNVRRGLAELEARTTGVGIRRELRPGHSSAYVIVFHEINAAREPDHTQSVESSTGTRENARASISTVRAKTRGTPREIARTPRAKSRGQFPLLSSPSFFPRATRSSSEHPALRAQRDRDLIEAQEVTRHRSLMDTLTDGDPYEVVESPLRLER